MTVVELFDRVVAHHADAPAVEDRARTLTYRELDASATAIARRLAARGIGPERLVGIFTRPSIETVIALLGVLKAGAAYVLLDVTYPLARLTAILEDSALPLVLVDRACHRARVLGELEQWVIDDTRAPATAALPAIDPASLAYVVFTSGSTGRPKGVAVTHAGITNLVERQIEVFRIHETSRLLQFAPLGFDAVVSEVFTALCAGATLCVEDRRSDADIAMLLERRAISVVTLPPSLLRVLPADRMPGLRTVVSAGEPCSAEIVGRWAPGRTLINAYGPSECTVCATMKTMAGPHDTPTIGSAIGGVDSYVLDDALATVPPDGVGELYLSSRSLARGYLGPTALTAERFVPDPFAGGGTRMYRTGDIVRRNTSGELEYLGRSDDQVKIRGSRVEPLEVEAVLRTMAGVDDVVVMPRQRASGETVLVAYLLARDAPVAVSDVHDFAYARLPAFLRPAEAVVVKAWPMSPNGKIDRKALASSPRSPRAPSISDTASTTEQKLEAIVRTLLDRDVIDLNRSFFEQGGDSIAAVRLVLAIDAAFGCKLELGALFECADLLALARRVDEIRSGQRSPRGRNVLLLRNGDHTPLWMPGPVHGNAVCYMSFARLLGRNVRCYGLQTPGLDGEREPIADFNALAAHQIQTIREHQPHGPYVLGGWSLGGTLAFEIAVQLEQAGERVSHLVLIGSTPPSADHLAHARETMKGYETWRMAYFYLRTLAFTLGFPIPLDFDEFQALPEDQVMPRFLSEVRALGPLGADITDELAVRWLGIVKANLYGFHHHTPSGTFHGRTLLIHTSGENPLVKDNLLRERKVSYGTWEGLLTGSVEERDVAANHYSTMLEPWVGELASFVDNWLKRSTDG